ncbi:tetratricopeptide repeat protein, partial [Staphylococcus arlettae]
ELAVANRALDDKDEALKYINAALKLNPGNENYQNLKKELED